MRLCTSRASQMEDFYKHGIFCFPNNGVKKIPANFVLPFL